LKTTSKARTKKGLMRLDVDTYKKFTPLQVSKLFGLDPMTTYRALAKQWHPDFNKSPGAQEVFQQLNDWYRWMTCHKKIDDVIFEPPVFEEGRCDVGHRIVQAGSLTYHFDDATLCSKFAEIGKRLDVKNSNTDVASVIFDRFPEPQNQVATPGLCSTLRFGKGYESLSLISKTQEIRPEHFAWILSHFWHALCYLGWKGIAHCDIQEEHVFIDREKHIVGIFGGWWCYVRFEDHIQRTSTLTTQRCPAYFKKGEVATPIHDIAVAKQMFLDIAEKQKLTQFIPYLQTPPKMYAFKEYGAWEQIRTELFGKPKFSKWE
jgi:hypothetical protein